MMSKLFSYVRGCHATNSSSSHSVLRMSQDTPRNLVVRRLPSEDMQYSWESFVLTTEEDKRKYLSIPIFNYYRKLGCSPEDSFDLMAKHVGVSEQSIESYFVRAGFEGGVNFQAYIDHQSDIVFPRPKRDDSITALWEWIVKNAIQDPDVFIEGGNDNSDNSPLAAMAEEGLNGITEEKFLSFIKGTYGTASFRVDKSGFISVYDAREGTKFRTFLPNGDTPRYSDTPELIDIKITDKCMYGCPQCYQNSTPEGLHASTDDLDTIAYKCKELGVYEVALGGGEPTLHPDFKKILKRFGEWGVTPNFSTKSMDWLQDEQILAMVNKYCGAVAFTADTDSDVHTWCDSTDDKFVGEGYRRPDAMVHYVLGLHPVTELQAVLDAAYDHWATVVLLGYKPIGRAQANAPYDYSGWLNVVEGSDSFKHGLVAIDSMLSAQVPQTGIVDPISYEVGDGRFSMYIDAVTNTAGPSSYANQTIAAASFYRLLDIWNEVLRLGGYI